MELAGKNLRFDLGDHTILVGIAPPHGFVESFVLAGFDGAFVIEDNRDGNLGVRFGATIEGHFAQGLVEDASGFLALELHLDALDVAVGCFRMIYAAGQEKKGAADHRETEDRTGRRSKVCQDIHILIMPPRHGMSMRILRLTDVDCHKLQYPIRDRSQNLAAFSSVGNPSRSKQHISGVACDAPAPLWKANQAFELPNRRWG